MRDETVARNYAEALYDLAERHEGLDVYGAGIDMVARLLDENPKFRLFLETPRIDAEDKKQVVRTTFEGELPRHLVNFLLVTIDKRRQRLLRTIAREFRALVDEHHGRVHVDVTVARPLGEETAGTIGRRLSRILGKTAIPHIRVDEDILGGMVARAGDTIYDGSLRRRLDRMKRQLLAADLPSASAVAGD